ncbi:MAG: phosphate ABC transporter substrate-binding protein PstS [Desulfurococcales archaeon]|nr:phosphate ABC transporter substrate-binding protein PstS [Desulfurococcales archaeon]
MNLRLLLAVIVLVIVALGGASLYLRGPDQSPEMETAEGTVGGEVALQGSGSTFIYPQIQAWANKIRGDYPHIIINYNPAGSGAGQAAFLDRTVDFAGSDPPLSRSQWESLRGEVVQLPVILGTVAIVYNLPGVSGLKLDGEALALIYKGEVEYWDDPVIAGQNPGVDLPHERIIVVHRSDSSGTTHVFTLFLHKAAPDVWPGELVGKTIDWPVDSTGRGIGGNGNQGVTEQVRSNEYSIGYVEYAYALKNNLNIALIKNREGVYTAPSVETAMAAASNALVSIPSSPLDDWSSALDAIVYAPGRDSYPITSWSFLLFYTKYEDPAKAEAVRAFIKWIIDKGYDYVVEGYAPIPEELREINSKALDAITVG